jgi:hypothetical protein
MEWQQMSDKMVTDVKLNKDGSQMELQGTSNKGWTDADGRLTNDRQSNEQMSSCNVAL